MREMRKARGWTQAQLAEAADLSTHFISMVERGDVSPSIPTLARLALALNVPLRNLFDFDLQRPPTPHELAIQQLLKATQRHSSKDILLLTRFLKKFPLPSKEKR